MALPLVFQTTEEWKGSPLGLHPVRVALQIARPELDSAIEPVVISADGGRHASGFLAASCVAVGHRSVRWDASPFSILHLNMLLSLTISAH